MRPQKVFVVYKIIYKDIKGYTLDASARNDVNNDSYTHAVCDAVLNLCLKCV